MAADIKDLSTVVEFHPCTPRKGCFESGIGDGRDQDSFIGENDSVDGVFLDSGSVIDFVMTKCDVDQLLFFQ